MAEVRKKQQSKVVRLNQEQMENKMIQDILDNFDFQKCYLAMSALKWTWGFDNRTPTIDELKESARERLINAIDIAKVGRGGPHITYYSSSGGLKGNAWINKYGHIEAVRLEFVLTDWDSDGDY